MRATPDALAYGGASTAGFVVGILTLDTRHPLLPGNVQNARSFDFPVVYEAVRLDDDPFALMRGDESLTARIVAAAIRLESLGVGVIAGACGSFAYYQSSVARAVSVPVFMSVMLQAPLLLASLGPSRKLLVLCAKASSMTDRVLAECGIIDRRRLILQEVAGRPEFDRMLAGDEPMNIRAFHDEVLDAARSAVAREGQIGAILLQCSDLPPVAAELQYQFQVPVFDAVVMIRWLAAAADYPPYAGPVRGPRRCSPTAAMGCP
jgi:Asp/Glu/hydantoin racemase